MRLWSWLAGVALVAAAWIVFASERAPTLPVEQAPVPPPATAPASEPVAADREALLDAPAAPPAQAHADSAPPPAAPWVARLFVTNADDVPVADAEITIWAALVQDRSLVQLSGVGGSALQGHAEQPLLHLRTDATGRARATLAPEVCHAAASKNGLGRSGEVLLWHERADAETRLVIEPPCVLHGVVLRADGTPAVGARVVAALYGFSTSGSWVTTSPPPATADAAGRFAIELWPEARYRLEAEDGARSLAETVWIRRREPAAVTLRFPGGITIDGLVVDADGNAVDDAQVKGWREFHADDPKQDPDDHEQTSRRTGADGRFSLPVRKCARYLVVARKNGCVNSAPTWVETNEVRPHAEVRLPLSRPARIAGRVVHGDGAPFAGIAVTARAEYDDPIGPLPINALPSSIDLFGEVTGVKTDADGRFALTVAPTTRWDVFAQPVAASWRLRAWQRGVTAGRDDIEIRISDQELAGCVVHGFVERSDGQALPDYRVLITDFAAGGARSTLDAKAAIDGARFTVPPLPRGERFAVWVCVGDKGAFFNGPLAPAVVGPFTADQSELMLTFRLQPWGIVNVRVLTADGTPARSVRVRPETGMFTNPELGTMPVDVDGRVSFARCSPGPARLKVFEETSQLCEQEVVITPGLNPEFTIHLPAAKPR